VDAYARTILADHLHVARLPPGPSYDGFWTGKAPDAYGVEGAELYWKVLWDTLNIYTHRRRLGVTENGWMGLVPAMAREGDAVCVLRGCEVPVLLRDDGGRRGWSFVGEAYVHGIMDGEGMRMVEGGVLGERDFEIR
jgi:hypothetical protein